MSTTSTSSGWNRSTSTPKPAPKKPSAMRGVVAGLVTVCALGGLCLWMFSGKDAAPKAKAEKERGRIKAVTPTLARTNKVVEAEKPKLTYEQEALKKIREQYGDNIPKSLKPIVYHLENPPKVTYERSASPLAFLHHRSERMIASMMMVEPGTLIVRQPTFDERFDEDFKAAAIEKIKILDDDSEEVREIKKAVQGVKDDFVKRIGAGEKVSDIMNSEGKALYDLGMYRHDLERAVDAVRNNPEASDDDVRDYVAAANKMLKEKGAAPLREPNFMFRSVSLAVARRRAQEREMQSAKTKEGK